MSERKMTWSKFKQANWNECFGCEYRETLLSHTISRYVCHAKEKNCPIWKQKTKPVKNNFFLDGYSEGFSDGSLFKKHHATKKKVKK